MSKQKVPLKSSEFQPKSEYALVKPAEQKEETTSGGIVLPTLNKSALDRPSSGEVISVGSDITDIAPSDFILWPDTDGLDLQFQDGDFVLLRYKSIIGSKKRSA